MLQQLQRGAQPLFGRLPLFDRIGGVRRARVDALQAQQRQREFGQRVGQVAVLVE
ncbi:hypothetical protein FQZ97_866940 [compost metagenome]